MPSMNTITIDGEINGVKEEIVETPLYNEMTGTYLVYTLLKKGAKATVGLATANQQWPLVMYGYGYCALVASKI